MPRLTLGAVQLSMLPQAIGACANDLPTIAKYVNRAQERLINCGGESGFWGGWQRVVFPLDRTFPYFTIPREWARVINMDVCKVPFRIQNEFFEYLEAGPGLQSRHDLNQANGCCAWHGCGAFAGYERGVWPSFKTLRDPNQFLKVYITDPRDVGKRILIGPAWDQNANQIYSTDGNNQVNGFYLTFTQPFAQSGFIVSRFDGIQKDPTYGQVILKQVDATSGTEVTLSIYQPDETIPAYRRYFVNVLPGLGACVQSPCVNPPTVPPVPLPPVTPGPLPPGTVLGPTVVNVSALVKLQYIPANLATDFLIIGCLPALIEEVKAIRYMDQDAPNAPQMAEVAHRRAIKMLQDEMRAQLGELMPAVAFSPFGTAHMVRPLRAIQFG